MYYYKTIHFPFSKKKTIEICIVFYISTYI